MLHHTSKNAIATLLLTNQNDNINNKYLKMTVVLNRSLRDAGYTEDIIVITNNDLCDDILTKEGIIIEKRTGFDYKALHQYKCNAWQLSQPDMHKIYFWSLSKYDKILALDCDILANKQMFNKWNLPAVQVIKSYNHDILHINSGMLLLEPSDEIFNDMFSLMMKSDFNKENGWNNCKTIETGIGIISNWSFQAANAIQGFVPYYFRENIYSSDLHIYFKHYSGKSKYIDEHYINTCKKNGFKLL